MSAHQKTKSPDDYSVIGKPVPQVNHRAKVLGRAVYAGDMKLPGMLHGAILRSPYPSALIRRIDTTKARQLPGVEAVLTGADAPDIPWGAAHNKERYILAKDQVKFAGEEVAAVAAIDEKTARQALDLIEVEYEELDPILTPEAALEQDTRLVHPERKTNISHEINVAHGDVDRAFATADLVHEATYTTSPQYPGYLEPMVSVANYGDDGRLHVWTSTQAVHFARLRIAAALGLPVSLVRVVQMTTGGGFGGKIAEDDNQLVVGLLALKTRKPVRLLNNRLEDFQACCTSLPERIWLKLGMTRDGMIIAKDLDILAGCGAYSGFTSDVVTVSSMRSDNLYRNPNVRCRTRVAYTNTPPHGAFRGFGNSQMLFAMNSIIDEMARELGLDSAEVHRKNTLDVGDVSVYGWKVESTGLKQCIDHVVTATDWKKKRQQQPDTSRTFRRGIGMGVAMHVSGARGQAGDWDGSTVSLRLNDDGGVAVLSGECDMGQGASTMLTQIVAEELRLPLAKVRVLAPDTDNTSFALGSFASRVTMIAGNAAMKAAGVMRQRILDLSSELLEAAHGDLEIEANGVVRVRGTDRTATFGDVARAALWRKGGATLQVTESWDAHTQSADSKLYGNVAPAHSYAAEAVEVEVDTETGRVKILDSYLSDDLGKALNPTAVHGQANGGRTQAIAWALYEELKFDGGRLQNGNFADYTVPVASAVPMYRGDFVESNDPHGPYGAKASSETAILISAAAIANAVYDAVGVRIRSLPITPEKILEGLDELNRQRGEKQDA